MSSCYEVSRAFSQSRTYLAADPAARGRAPPTEYALISWKAVGAENRPGFQLLELCSLPRLAPSRGTSHLLLTCLPPPPNCWPISSAFAFSNYVLWVPMMLPHEGLVPPQKPFQDRHNVHPFPDLGWSGRWWPIHSC